MLCPLPASKQQPQGIVLHALKHGWAMPVQGRTGIDTTSMLLPLLLLATG
jgi:hypothetical protein